MKLSSCFGTKDLRIVILGCLHGHARSYNGRWSKTNTGRQCQRWDAQFPHEHQMNFSSYFPKDKSIHDAHNYCRDPDYTCTVLLLNYSFLRIAIKEFDI